MLLIAEKSRNYSCFRGSVVSAGFRVLVGLKSHDNEILHLEQGEERTGEL